IGDRRQLRCSDERQNSRQQLRRLYQVLCHVRLPVGRSHHCTDRQGVLPEKLRQNQRLLPGGRGLCKRLTQLVGPDLADILPGLDLTPGLKLSIGLELSIWPAEPGAALAGELTERIALEELRHLLLPGLLPADRGLELLADGRHPDKRWEATRHPPAG